jgi:iron complex transport system substrate-binding protein
VIRFGGNQDPRTPARLDEFGITHAAVRPDRIADLYASVILLGRLTGADQAADSLVTAIEEGLAELSRNAESLPRLRAAYVLGGTPPWVAGPNTYIDEILDLLGADNVFSDLGALYTSVSREEIRARDIDVVLVSDASQFDGTLAPDARVVEIGSALEVPGPDVVRSARDVAELLRGPSGR